MLKRPNLLLAAGVMALCLLAGHARADTADNQALLNRVVELEAQVRNMSQQRPYSGSAAYPASDTISSTANGSSAFSSNVSAPDMESRLSALETQLRNLTGQVEQSNYQNQQTNASLQKLSSDVDFRLQQLEQRQAMAPTNAPPPVAASTDPNAPITNMPQAAPPPVSALATNAIAPAAVNQDGPTSPEELYNRAYSEMQRKEYGTAQQDFKSFIASNPDHKLTPNAQYWLGEIYYAQGNYKLASATFADGYQKAPKGSKAPDNLLKLGLSLEQQNRTKDACTVLRQLIKDYPSAPDTITSGATRGIKRMQCSA